MSSKCQPSPLKKYTSRPSPPYPANDCPNMVKVGNDGKKYKSVANKNGVYGWKITSAETSSRKISLKVSRKSSSRKSSSQKHSSRKTSRKLSNKSTLQQRVIKMFGSITLNQMKLKYHDYSYQYVPKLDRITENLVMKCVDYIVLHAFSHKLTDNLRRIQDLYLPKPELDGQSVIYDFGNEFKVYYGKNQDGIFVEAYMAPGGNEHGCGIFYDFISKKIVWLFANGDRDLVGGVHEKDMIKGVDYRLTKKLDKQISDYTRYRDVYFPL